MSVKDDTSNPATLHTPHSTLDTSNQATLHTGLAGPCTMHSVVQLYHKTITEPEIHTKFITLDDVVEIGLMQKFILLILPLLCKTVFVTGLGP